MALVVKLSSKLSAGGYVVCELPNGLGTIRFTLIDRRDGRIAVEAPESVRILRDELYEQQERRREKDERAKQ